MMKRTLILIAMAISTTISVVGQVTTPNLGLTLPPPNTPNWGYTVNNNFAMIDTFAGTQIITVTTAPTGSCTSPEPIERVASTGSLYNCQSGTWTLLGGGGGNPAGPAFALNFANSGVNAFQGDSTLTFNTTTKQLTANYFSSPLQGYQNTSTNYDVVADGGAKGAGNTSTCNWVSQVYTGCHDDSAVLGTILSTVTKYTIFFPKTTSTGGNCDYYSSVALTIPRYTNVKGVYAAGFDFIGGGAENTTICFPTQTGGFTAEGQNEISFLHIAGADAWKPATLSTYVLSARDGGSGANADGLVVTSESSVHDLAVTGFARDCLSANSNLAPNSSDAINMVNVFAAYCRGYGIFHGGGDGQVGNVINAQAQFNQLYGIFEANSNSQYGNTYEGGNTAANHSPGISVGSYTALSGTISSVSCVAGTLADASDVCTVTMTASNTLHVNVRAFNIFDRTANDVISCTGTGTGIDGNAYYINSTTSNTFTFNYTATLSHGAGGTCAYNPGQRVWALANGSAAYGTWGGGWGVYQGISHFIRPYSEQTDAFNEFTNITDYQNLVDSPNPGILPVHGGSDHQTAQGYQINTLPGFFSNAFSPQLGIYVGGDSPLGSPNPANTVLDFQNFTVPQGQPGTKASGGILTRSTRGSNAGWWYLGQYGTNNANTMPEASLALPDVLTTSNRSSATTEPWLPNGFFLGATTSSSTGFPDCHIDTGTAAPTSGSWQVCDLRLNTAYAGGTGVWAWENTVAGTPGTWSTLSFGTGGGGSSAWSSLTNPTTNLALTMGAFTSTFTYGATTGSSDLMKWTDTASNTGTGIMVHPTTASGSTEVPFQADANGVGFQISPVGALASVGSTAGANVALGATGLSSQSLIKIYGSTGSSNKAPGYAEFLDESGAITGFLYGSTTFAGQLGIASTAPTTDVAAGGILYSPGGVSPVYTTGASSTVGLLQCFSGSSTVTDCASNATTFIGVTEATGNSNTRLKSYGVVTVAIPSSTTTAGDFICSGTLSAGVYNIADSGSTPCSAGQQVGFAAITNASPVTSVKVQLTSTAGIAPGSGGVGSTGEVGVFNASNIVNGDVQLAHSTVTSTLNNTDTNGIATQLIAAVGTTFEPGVIITNPNDTTTGTTAAAVVKINSSGNAINATTSDTTALLYVEDATHTNPSCAPGTTGNACLISSGWASVTFDASGATQGDMVGASTTTAHTAHDLGSSSGGVTCLGRALANVAANAVGIIDVGKCIPSTSTSTPSISVGTVSSLAPNATPTVTNTGSTTAAVFAFGLPVNQMTGAPSPFRFFGDGSEGALNLATGTQTIVGEHWYSSITVASGATLINNSAAPLILRSTGSCTIAGTISASANSGAAGLSTTQGIGGGGGGGGGGGTAAGTIGSGTSIAGASSATLGQGGAAGGAASGGTGSSASTTLQAAGAKMIYSGAVPWATAIVTAPITIGGSAGGAGGSSGGAGGKGGMAVFITCPSITFTGTIDASGQNGANSAANNTGSGGGGGGGMIGMAAVTYVTNTGTMNVTAGSGGTCGSFTTCGAGGTGAAGISSQFTIQ